MRNATLILLFLLSALPFTARAQEVPLPPPMIISSVVPPVVIPSEIVVELQKGASTCAEHKQVFNFKVGTLAIADFNGDSRADYVLTTGGYLCNNEHTLFESPQGDTYSIFFSRPAGGLAKHETEMRAYGLQVDSTKTPSQMTFTVGCPENPDPAARGKTSLHWERDKLRTISREIGCYTAMITAKKEPEPRKNVGESADQIRNIEPAAGPVRANQVTFNKAPVTTPVMEKPPEAAAEPVKETAQDTPHITAQPLRAEDLLDAPEKPVAAN